MALPTGLYVAAQGRSNNSAQSVTFGSALTPGTTLVVGIVSNNASAPVLTLTGGGAPVLSQAVYTAGHNGDFTGIFYLPGSSNTGGGTGCSVTSGGAIFAIGTCEYFNILQTSPLIATTTGGNATAGTTASCAAPSAGNYAAPFQIYVMAYDVTNGGTAYKPDGFSSIIGPANISNFGQWNFQGVGAPTAVSMSGMASGTYDVCSATFAGVQGAPAILQQPGGSTFRLYYRRRQAPMDSGAQSPPNILPGVQVQSKFRRPIQQPPVNNAPPPVVVPLQTAQFVLNAIPVVPSIIGLPGLTQQSKFGRKTQTPMDYGSQAPPVILPGLQQQSKFRRPQQQYPNQTTLPVVVPLLTAQFTLTAYPVTPTIIFPQTVLPGLMRQSTFRRRVQQIPMMAPPQFPGSGSGGLIKVTFPVITGQLLYSVSGAVETDQYGNALAVGYQGPISALQPLVSTPTSTETWHSLSLVSAQAGPSGNGVNGFWYIYRSNNEVELLWDLNVTNTGGAYIGVMPNGYIPLRQQNFISGWYGTGPTSYASNFQPHLNIQGIHDPVPGAIYTFGGNVQPLGFFGRGKYLLVVP